MKSDPDPMFVSLATIWTEPPKIEPNPTNKLNRNHNFRNIDTYQE
jgi:hypothetical protein